MPGTRVDILVISKIKRKSGRNSPNHSAEHQGSDLGAGLAGEKDKPVLVNVVTPK
jgi:hypothetical protein